jgi:hypothetical protein
MKSGLRSNLRPRVLLPTAVLALLGVGVGAFAFSGTPAGGDEPLPPIVRPAATTEDAPSGPSSTRAAWARTANSICAAHNAELRLFPSPQTRNELLLLVPRTLDLSAAALVELKAVPRPRRHAARIGRMVSSFERFVALQRKAVEALAAGDAAAYAAQTGHAFAANDRGNRIARDLGVRACGAGGTDETELARELERHDVVVAVLYSPGASVDRLAIEEARAGAVLANAGFVAIDVFDPREIAPVAASYAVRGAPAVLVLRRAEGAVTQFDGYVDRETVAQAVDNASV